MDDVLKKALLVDDPEKLFKKPEKDEKVLVPTETPEPSEEIRAH